MCCDAHCLHAVTASMWCVAAAAAARWHDSKSWGVGVVGRRAAASAAGAPTVSVKVCLVGVAAV